jgi:hypothetical protein
MTNALVEMGNATINPFVHIWNNLIQYLPGLIGAIIVSLIGYLIAYIIGNIVKHALDKAKLDSWVCKRGYSRSLLNIKLSVLIGQLVKWGVFIAFLAPAANLIKLTILSNLITTFALWIPNLILAIIVVVIGIILGRTVSKSIHSKDHKGSKLVADILEIVIVIAFLDIALNQIGIAIVFVEQVILVIIGAILITCAIVVGIGFGNSIRKHADSIVTKYIDKKK